MPHNHKIEHLHTKSPADIRQEIQDIPEPTTVLDLSNNLLSSLHIDRLVEFLGALPDLHTLNVSRCSLEELEDLDELLAVFAAIPPVKCLDLRGNDLDELDTNTLENLLSHLPPSVETVVLDGRCIDWDIFRGFEAIYRPEVQKAMRQFALFRPEEEPEEEPSRFQNPVYT